MSVDPQAPVPRFSQLLKPIRDLTKNWEVDIEAELEIYLQEISEGSNKDGNGLNFAEAALLIQGSTLVYCKKVEFLHDLLSRVMDTLMNKKTSSNTKQTGRDDENEPFLDDNPRLTAVTHLAAESDDSITLHENQNGLNNSIATRATLQLALSVGHTSVIDTPFSNKIDGAEFKMNSCILSDSGALLLSTAFATDSLSDSIRGQMEPGFVRHQTNELVDVDIEDLNDDIPAATPTTMNYDLVDDPPDVDPTMDTEASMPEAVVNRRARSKATNWAMLDPHHNNNQLKKPYKKGKPFRIPDVKSLTATVQVPSVVNFTDDFTIQSTNIALPFFKDLQPIMAIMYKKKYSETKRRRKEALVSGGVVELDDVMAPLPLDQPMGIPELDYAAPDLPLADDGMEEDHGPDILPEDVLNSSFSRNYATSELQDAIQNMGLDDTNIFYQGNYEDLCRQHVEKYMLESQMYIQETALSKRVSEWTQKLEPLLKEQEARPNFDIKSYGKQIMEEFPGDVNDHPTVDFHTISNTQPYDVCRKFAAMLQLANHGNIQIIAGGKAEDATDSIRLQLIDDTERVDIEAYVPASLDDKFHEAFMFDHKQASRKPSKRKKHIAEDVSVTEDEMSSAGSDSSDEDDDMGVPAKRGSKKVAMDLGKPAQKKRAKKVRFSDDDDMEDDEMPAPKSKPKLKKAASKRPREDDDEFDRPAPKPKTKKRLTRVVIEEDED